MILIYSSNADPHACEVARCLAADFGQEPFVFDLGWYPTQMSLVARVGSVEPSHEFRLPNGQRFDHREVRAVWWRRPRPFRLDPDVLAAGHGEFALSECASALHGVWMDSPCMWVNPIHPDDRASRKLYQLSLARRIGLRIPDTLITNDPTEARSFWELHQPRIIQKGFLGTETGWRETRLVPASALEHVGSVGASPTSSSSSATRSPRRAASPSTSSSPSEVPTVSDASNDVTPCRLRGLLRRGSDGDDRDAYLLLVEGPRAGSLLRIPRDAVRGLRALGTEAGETLYELDCDGETRVAVVRERTAVGAAPPATPSRGVPFLLATPHAVARIRNPERFGGCVELDPWRGVTDPKLLQDSRLAC